MCHSPKVDLKTNSWANIFGIFFVEEVQTAIYPFDLITTLRAWPEHQI